MKAAGITAKSARGLQHSFACRVYGWTGDLQITQAALGHASIVSTRTCAKVDRALLRVAVGA
jgi:integrase